MSTVEPATATRPAATATVRRGSLPSYLGWGAVLGALPSVLLLVFLFATALISNEDVGLLVSVLPVSLVGVVSFACYGIAQGTAGWFGMALVSPRVRSPWGRGAAAAIAVAPIAVVGVALVPNAYPEGLIFIAVTVVGAFLATVVHEVRAARI